MKSRILLLSFALTMLVFSLSSCGTFGKNHSSPHCPAFNEVQQKTGSSHTIKM